VSPFESLPGSSPPGDSAFAARDGSPSSPMSMCGLPRSAHWPPATTGRTLRKAQDKLRMSPTHDAGVKSSSHSSTPITVSSVATTASPNGTCVWPVTRRTIPGSECCSVCRCLSHGVKWRSSRWRERESASESATATATARLVTSLHSRSYRHSPSTSWGGSARSCHCG
jgi:hypothetical protein